jgi:hypothetical protein
MEREGANPVQVLVGWTSLQENVKWKVFTGQCVTSQKTCVFSNTAVRTTYVTFQFLPSQTSYIPFLQLLSLF